MMLPPVLLYLFMSKAVLFARKGRESEKNKKHEKVRCAQEILVRVLFLCKK